jgi:hypothetical protein
VPKITAEDLMRAAEANGALMRMDGKQLFEELEIDQMALKLNAAAFAESYDDAGVAFYFGVLAGLRAARTRTEGLRLAA